MRKALSSYLLFIVSLLSVKADAQHDYIPIPDSAVYITEIENWWEGENPPPPHTFYYDVGYFWGIDTIINNKEYMCFYEAQFNQLPYSGSYLALAGIWIHQDTIQKKVWWVMDQINLNGAYLLYDFSLQVGDSLSDNNHIYFRPDQDLGGQKAWVEQIDSVFFPDNTWRYRWWIKSNYTYTSTPGEAIMIEGMGYTTGLKNDPLGKSRPLIAYTYELTCFNGNNQWLYHVPNVWGLDCEDMAYDNALNISSVTNELDKPLLYPNPVANGERLYVNSYSGKGPCKLEAYNLSGAKVLSMAVRAGESISLADQLLQSGLYLFRLCDSQNRLVHTQKIMVK